jgi:uncharacterized lipoprotein YmbA
MKVKLVSGHLAIILALAAVFLSGCSRSPSPRFYALNPVQDQAVSRSSGPGRNAVVGIGPVKLADYLDQSLIVTRTGDNQVVKAQFDRWAGPLRNNFVNVLAENIGFLLPTDQIQLHPWPVDLPVDYQVTVDVVRFDGRLGDAARLESRWSILKGTDRKLAKTGRASISEPVTGPDYADLVAAQSRAVAKLSQEIVRAVKRVGPPEPAEAPTVEGFQKDIRAPRPCP